MANNLKNIVECIESEGFEVMSYRPDRKRIYTICQKVNEGGGVVTLTAGMYANELRAWFRGYLQGLKIKAKSK